MAGAEWCPAYCADHKSLGKSRDKVHGAGSYTAFSKAKDNIKVQLSDSHTARRSENWHIFLEHNLAIFFKTKDAPALWPSFNLEKAVPQNHAHTCTEAEAQTCWPQMPMTERNQKQPTCPSKCTKMQGHSPNQVCNCRKKIIPWKIHF